MTKQYFQHDYNARNSLQLQALMAEFGDSAYGIFWAVVEVLHEMKNKVPLKQYIYAGIADQIKSNPEKVEKVILFSIEKIELFTEKKGFFSSVRVKHNIIKRLAISKVRAKSGKHGANVKQNLAKEKKEKEIKEKEINKENNWGLEKMNFSNDFKWKEKFTQDKKITMYQLEGKMKEFISDLELREDYKDLKELRNHFTNWFNLKTKNSNHQNSPAEFSGAPTLKRI